MEHLAKIEHKARGLSPGDILFVSVTWTIFPALWLFMLCLEAIWGDVTFHSNNKGFDLLTFSCQTSVGKQLIFLWIWIPNWKCFSLQWVTSNAIQFLIPLKIRQRVKFITKDGDSQQQNELWRALKEAFPNAIKGGFGWHIRKWTNQYFIFPDNHIFSQWMIFYMQHFSQSGVESSFWEITTVTRWIGLMECNC